MNINFTSISDYANEKNISYEAVRKQVVRYKNQLESHIKIVNRTQYLDEYAVDFLNQKRSESPIVVRNEQSSEELEELRMKVEALTNQLMANQQEMIALQKESRVLLEQNHEARLLLTKNEQKVADYDRMHEAWGNSNMQRMAAETEAQKMRQEKEQVEQNFKSLEQSSVAMQEAYEQQLRSFEAMTPREFKRYKKQLKKQGRI